MWAGYDPQNESALGLFSNNSGHLIDDGTSLNGQPTLKAAVWLWTNTPARHGTISPFANFQAGGDILVNSAGDLRLVIGGPNNTGLPGAANWGQLDFQLVETKPGIYVASNDAMTALVSFRRGNIRLTSGPSFPTG